MTFVLNGCSFSANYYEARHLATSLGYTNFVSLARGGRSNRQIIRTTLEYIESNPVEFVLLGLSMWDRYESDFITAVPDTDNWVNYRRQGVHDGSVGPDTEFHSGTDFQDVDVYIRNKYTYEHSLKSMDQLMCDLVMFTAYLESKSINYCIYNTCETNYSKYFETVNSFYLPIIQKNKRIVPLDTFISNLFLYEQGSTWADAENIWPNHSKHYDGECYRHLNNYLLYYIKENNLL